jgi:hypothetical protein
MQFCPSCKVLLFPAFQGGALQQECLLLLERSDFGSIIWDILLQPVRHTNIGIKLG